MNIQVIASGSKGNAAIISHNDNKLLLDAGISIDRIGKALGYDLTGLDGALISHEHKDHSMAIKDLMKLHIDCYMSEGTAWPLQCNKNHYFHKIVSMSSLIIGNWYVLPFAIEHDATEPLGFLIAIGKECKLLYVIDTPYVEYLFNDLTHIMIECNYSLDIVRQKTKSDELQTFLKNRLLRSHMSLETCKRFLQANDLSKIREIWLLHISDRHGDKELFKSEIQKLTGKLIKTS